MKKIKTSATPISWMYAAVIIYASLYPFSGWRNQDIRPWEFLWAPLPLYWTANDVFINLLGYVPFGFVLTLADLRVNKKNKKQLSYNWIIGVFLSLILESLQTYLPSRVPSTVDLFLNALGTLTGFAIACFFEKHHLIDTWNQIRSRWLIKESVGPLACLCVWPLAIFYPPTTPFLMGDIFWRLKISLAELLVGTPFEKLLSVDYSTKTQFGFMESVVCVMTGLMVPILLSYSIVPVFVHRLWLILGLTTMGLAVLMVSSTLTFGLVHVFSWFSIVVLIGVVLGVCMSLLLLKARTTLTQIILLGVLGIHLLLTNGINSDVYLAQSIHIWEQGKNARYIGLTQWVCWFWPYVVFILILFRLSDQRINRMYTHQR
jgi:VanZ family protein